MLISIPLCGVTAMLKETVDHLEKEIKTSLNKTKSCPAVKGVETLSKEQENLRYSPSRHPGALAIHSSYHFPLQTSNALHVLITLQWTTLSDSNNAQPTSKASQVTHMTHLGPLT
jgi:hypothetical protein